MNESTDIQNIPQLAIFIHYVTNDENVKGELLDKLKGNHKR